MQHPVSDPRAAAHLEAERLAALADETPTPGEAAHLAACPACRREREAYVALVALARAEGAGDRPAGVYADDAFASGGSDAYPAGAGGDPWTALAAALRAEGLTDGASAPDAPLEGGRRGRIPAAAPRWARRPAASWAHRAPARLAAALVLLVGAAAAGRVSATRGPLAAAAALGPAGSPEAAAQAFASSEEARTALARARRDYARAAAFLATTDPLGNDAALAALDAPAADAAARGADAEVLRARVATLDALLPRVRAAARQAPEDPAVNQLYLAAYDARETALRELGRTLPAGVELTGY
jgi:hypothetical protein